MKKSECSLSVFFEIGLAGGAQLVVPFLAEAARQRTLKKLIQPHVVFFCPSLPRICRFSNDGS